MFYFEALPEPNGGVAWRKSTRLEKCEGICLWFDLRGCKKTLQERQALEMVSQIVNRSKIDWFHRVGSQWIVDVDGLLSHAQESPEFPWLTGLAVVNPEFDLQERESFGRTECEGRVLFLITRDSLIRSSKPVGKRALEPFRRWLATKYLEEPAPELFALSDTEVSKPLVLIPFPVAAHQLLEMDLDPLTTLDTCKELRWIEDIRVDIVSTPEPVVRKIPRSLLDRNLEPGSHRFVGVCKDALIAPVAVRAKYSPPSPRRPIESKPIDIDRANFKIALSFPGERRQYVHAVSKHLKRWLPSGSVFYDKDFEGQLARLNLDTLLQRIYRDNSSLVVVFLCAEYDKKKWCGIEWRAIREIINKRADQSLMLMKFDDAEVRGVFSHDGYVDLRKLPTKKAAELILERLRLIEQTEP